MQKIKLVHVITGLHQGGAEAVLYRLLVQLDQNKYDITVISLMGPGIYSQKIQNLGILVFHLKIHKWFFLVGLVKLYALLKKLKPDIVQTWMDHANFLGGIVAKLVGCKKIIWGIRGSRVSPGLAVAVIDLLCIRLSRFLPTCIVTPSNIVMQEYIHKGYSKKKFTVIANGIDLASLPQERTAICSDHRVLTMGMLARFHPQKDYPNFLRAIHLVNQRMHHECKFLLAGKDVDCSVDLIKLSKALKLKNVELLSAFDNPMSFYKKIDFFVLSSAFGEAFPNVVAEAMSCSIPCVVTDVGDAAYIVGDTGLVVPPKNSEALAQACEKMLSLSSGERVALGRKARARIIENFSIDKMVTSYEDVYSRIQQGVE